jgi:diguanylate cyclase (GGDEF)-like protein
MFKSIQNITYFAKNDDNYIKNSILGKNDDNSLNYINRAFNNMEYLFVDKGQTYIFSHKIGDFSIKILKNKETKNNHKILIPIYILQKNDLPIKLGVICFEGHNLILDGEKNKDNIKTTMIVLSIIFSSISQMIYKRFDKLTSLISRNEFDFELNNSLSQKPKTITFIIADIDHFKNINDTLGHDIGDLVLKQFGSRILSQIRTNSKDRIKDLAIRWGGEEFLVLLFNSNIEYSKIVAERIRNHITNKDFFISKTKTIPVTCSLGLSFLNCGNKKPNKKTILEYIKMSDLALYKAKNSGRNKLEIYSEK